MVNDTHTRRRRLQPKAPFDILVAVLHYCFFFRCSCSATAGRIFTESSPKDIFAVLFINVDTPTQSAPSPPKKLGGSNVHFLSENSHSTVFGWPLRRNEEEFWENCNNWYDHSI